MYDSLNVLFHGSWYKRKITIEFLIFAVYSVPDTVLSVLYLLTQYAEHIYKICSIISPNFISEETEARKGKGPIILVWATCSDCLPKTAAWRRGRAYLYSGEA